ncbi:MAG: P1 family peptidase [Clostridiales bacterium]|nr:P1 family peptidase [Clostridiales bacterium]
MREIPVTDIKPLYIGQVEDAKGGTGITVFVSPEGMRAGIDVRGGGPASRETALLEPLTSPKDIHAVVLAGGSAFGLGAASGVMKCLEERGIGYDVGVTRVPLVVQSDLFDLTVGDPQARPDEDMGYRAACQALDDPNYRDGNYGAGCGATVGKITGMERAVKTGIGSYAIELEGLRIGAVVAVNALGDIYDCNTGKIIAGLLNEDRTGFSCSPAEMERSIRKIKNRFVKNTTLGVVITNAGFDKTALCKIAGMGHDGYARSIRPVHTSFDGDTIYALSVGDVDADQEVVGTLASEVISEAIIRAVYSAESAYGIPCAKDIAK